MTNEVTIPTIQEYDDALEAWKNAHGRHLRPSAKEDMAWIAGYSRAAVDRRLAAEPTPEPTPLERAFNPGLPAVQIANEALRTLGESTAMQPFRAYVDLGAGERIFATGETLADLIKAIEQTDSNALNRPAEPT